MPLLDGRASSSITSDRIRSAWRLPRIAGGERGGRGRHPLTGIAMDMGTQGQLVHGSGMFGGTTAGRKKILVPVPVALVHFLRVTSFGRQKGTAEKGTAEAKGDFFIVASPCVPPLPAAAWLVLDQEIAWTSWIGWS